MELHLTSSSFEQEVYQAEVPVLVDFYADWCGPCKAMAPVVEELAKEYEGKAKVGKINTDENQDIAIGICSLIFVNYHLLKLTRLWSQYFQIHFKKWKSQGRLYIKSRYSHL